MVNPAGAENQIEIGIIRAASWTVKEEVRVDETGVLTNAWERYPILTFPEVPEVIVRFVGDAADPALGLGEAAVELCGRRKLATADAPSSIPRRRYATAPAHGADLLTCDRHFEGLHGVRFVAKPGR